MGLVGGWQSGEQAGLGRGKSAGYTEVWGLQAGCRGVAGVQESLAGPAGLIGSAGVLGEIGEFSTPSRRARGYFCLPIPKQRTTHPNQDYTSQITSSAPKIS